MNEITEVFGRILALLLQYRDGEEEKKNLREELVGIFFRYSIVSIFQIKTVINLLRKNVTLG